MSMMALLHGWNIKVSNTLLTTKKGLIICAFPTERTNQGLLGSQTECPNHPVNQSVVLLITDRSGTEEMTLLTEQQNLLKRHP